MRCLLDENADARLRAYLQGQGYDATAIAVDYPSALSDAEVLAIAHREGRILIPNDKDFGDLIFQQRLPHAGVILLRLGDYTPLSLLIARLDFVLTNYATQLDRFVTVTPRTVRLRG